MKLHITPGIPVSRRSASNSYSATNSYYTSPIGEKGEMLKVNLGDESIDSYAAVMHEEIDDKSQYQEERSSSATSEATSKNTPEMELDIEKHQPEQQEQQPTQEQVPSPPPPAPQEQQPLPEEEPYHHEETEFPIPMVQIEEDNIEVPVEIPRRDSINYACAPPKKRLRVKENAYSTDNFPESKVSSFF